MVGHVSWQTLSFDRLYIVSHERPPEADAPQLAPIYCAGWSPLSGPDAPVRRLHGYVFSGLGLDPAAEDPAARKDHPVNGIILDHGNLQIPIKGRRRFEPLPGQVAIGSWTVFIAAG